MTDATGAAILKAILDEPGDDLHRLALADWLEDGGGRFGPKAALLHAELIRVQVEADAMGEVKTVGCWCNRPSCRPCRQRWLIGREAELLDAAGYYAIHHRADEPTAIILGKDRLTISRGFVSRWEMTLSQWLEHGPALVRRHPLTRVELSDRRVSANYGWYGSDVLPDHNNLPLRLWGLLTDHRHRDEAWKWKWFPTEAAANDALSDACLRLAKEAK